MPDKQLDLVEKCHEIIKIAKTSQRTYVPSHFKHDLIEAIKDMVVDAVREGADSAVLYFQKTKSGNDYELAMYYDFKEETKPKESSENK